MSKRVHGPSNKKPSDLTGNEFLKEDFYRFIEGNYGQDDFEDGTADAMARYAKSKGMSYSEDHKRWVVTDISKVRRRYDPMTGRRVGYSVAEPMVALYTKDALGIVPKATFVLIGAGIGPRLNGAVTWRPLGEHVTPSRAAIPVSLGAAVALREYGYPRAADAAMSTCIGLVVGEVARAIAAKA